MPSILTRAPDAVWISVLALLALQASFLVPPTGYAVMMARSAHRPEDADPASSPARSRPISPPSSSCWRWWCCCRARPSRPAQGRRRAARRKGRRRNRPQALQRHAEVAAAAGRIRRLSAPALQRGMAGWSRPGIAANMPPQSGEKRNGEQRLGSNGQQRDGRSRRRFAGHASHRAGRARSRSSPPSRWSPSATCRSPIRRASPRPACEIAKDPDDRLRLHRPRQPGGRDLQRHRRAGPGRPRRAGQQAGDGRQGRPVQALRRRRLHRPRGRHQGRRRVRQLRALSRADLRRHQPRGHQGAGVLHHRAAPARADGHPGLPRRPARHRHHLGRRPDQRAAPHRPQHQGHQDGGERRGRRRRSPASSSSRRWACRTRTPSCATPRA